MIKTDFRRLKESTIEKNIESYNHSFIKIFKRASKFDVYNTYVLKC